MGFELEMTRIFYILCNVRAHHGDSAPFLLMHLKDALKVGVKTL